MSVQSIDSGFCQDWRFKIKAYLLPDPLTWIGFTVQGLHGPREHGPRFDSRLRFKLDSIHDYDCIDSRLEWTLDSTVDSDSKKHLINYPGGGRRG